MKLKTKLIPLASVAAVCATVAPITLTSCGNNSFVSLVDGYKPSYEQLKNEGTTNKDEIKATKDFCDLINQNPSYFSEELYWSNSNTVQVLNRLKGIVIDNPSTASINEKPLILFLNLTFDTCNYKISNLSITTKTIKVNFNQTSLNFEFEIPVANFTLEYDLQVNDFEQYINSVNSNSSEVVEYSDLDLHIVGKEVYTDVPFIVRQSDYLSLAGKTNAWTVFPFIELSNHGSMIIKKLNAMSVTGFNLDWSVAIDYTYTAKGVRNTGPSGDIIIDTSRTKSMLINEDFLIRSNAGASDSMIREYVSYVPTSYYLFQIGYEKGQLSNVWEGRE